MRSIKLNITPVNSYDAQEMIAEFMQIQMDKGVTTTTLKQHGYALKHLHEAHPGLPNETDVRRCLPPTMGSSYYNKRLTTYRMFFDYLISLGRMLESPVKNYHYRKTGIHIVKYEDCNVQKLLDNIDTSTYSGYRDYTIAMLILDSGIRPSEVLRIEERDINFDAKEINLRAEITKTRTNRIVPVSVKTLFHIRKLVSFKLKEWNTPLVFITADGRPMQTFTFRYNLRMACIKAGVSINPYDLRHIFATSYIRNGGDVFSLQRILGHSTPNTTMVYVNLNTEDLHKKHEQVSVLNNFLNAKSKLGKIY